MAGILKAGANSYYLGSFQSFAQKVWLALFIKLGALRATQARPWFFPDQKLEDNKTISSY